MLIYKTLILHCSFFATESLSDGSYSMNIVCAEWQGKCTILQLCCNKVALRNGRDRIYFQAAKSFIMFGSLRFTFMKFSCNTFSEWSYCLKEEQLINSIAFNHAKHLKQDEYLALNMSEEAWHLKSESDSHCQQLGEAKHTISMNCTD